MLDASSLNMLPGTYPELSQYAHYIGERSLFQKLRRIFRDMSDASRKDPQL